MVNISVVSVHFLDARKGVLMKKFITTVFYITLFLSGFEKIYTKNCGAESSNSCGSNSSSASCDMAGLSSVDCGNSSSNQCGCQNSVDSYSSLSCDKNSYYSSSYNSSYNDSEDFCGSSCNNSSYNNSEDFCGSSCGSSYNNSGSFYDSSFDGSCNDSVDLCDNSCNSSCDSQSCEGDCSLCCATPVRTVFHARSQGANTARELVGWQWELNLPFMCNNWGAAYFVYEYQRSFNNKILANVLFGSSTLNFAGSLVPDRTSNDLLAENFGLAQDFQGSIRFDPQMQNHIFDFGYFQGFDCFIQGSYLRVHAPVVLTYWSLRPCQRVITQGSSDFSPCFVDSTTGQPTVTASSILEALTGDFLFGDMKTRWCAGKFDPRTRHRLGLADIDFILGYNFKNTDCYHLGIYAQLVMPSGPKYKDKYVFDPVVGNYGHFEVGIGFSAHAIFWSCENHSLATFLEGNLTHMCKTRQCRLFDFQHAGAFSRYILLKQYDYAGNYTGNLISAACFNNRSADVALDIKGDVSVKLAYRACGWGIDLGYNIYGHSSESVRLKDKSCTSNLLQYAIKGTAPVCCSNYPVLCIPTTGGIFERTIYPANSTDIPADALNCAIDPITGLGECTNINTPFKPPYTVKTVKNNGAQPRATAFAPSPINVSTNQITCSVCLSQPVNQPLTITDLETEGFVLVNNTTPTRFVSSADFNINSARSIGVLTHKVFWFFNYQWFDRFGWNPALGIGGEIEFNDKQMNDLNSKNSGLSQWGVFTKWNISF